MKRILSIFLAFVMVLSCMAVLFMVPASATETTFDQVDIYSVDRGAANWSEEWAISDMSIIIDTKGKNFGGFALYTKKDTTDWATVETPTVNVNVYDCDATGTQTSQTPIATDSFTVDSTAGWKTVMFDTVLPAGVYKIAFNSADGWYGMFFAGYAGQTDPTGHTMKLYASGAGGQGYHSAAQVRLFLAEPSVDDNINHYVPGTDTIVLHSDTNTTNPQTSQKFGYTVNTNARTLNGVSIYVGTYGVTHTLDVNIYAWDSSANATTGTPVKSGSIVSTVSDGYVDFMFEDAPLPAGEYFVEYTQTGTNQMAVFVMTESDLSADLLKYTCKYATIYYSNNYGQFGKAALVSKIHLGATYTNATAVRGEGDDHNVISTSSEIVWLNAGKKYGVMLNTGANALGSLKFYGASVFTSDGSTFTKAASGQVKAEVYKASDITESTANAAGSGTVYGITPNAAPLETVIFTQAADSDMVINFTKAHTGKLYVRLSAVDSGAVVNVKIKDDSNITNDVFVGAREGCGYFGTQQPKVDITLLKLMNADVKFASASVTVGESYSINFKVNSIVLDNATSFSVAMSSANGETVTITEKGEVKNGMYAFSYTDILPQNVADKVTATLTVDGKTDTIEYSVKDYCESKLGGGDTLAEVCDNLLVYAEAVSQHVGNTAGTVYTSTKLATLATTAPIVYTGAASLKDKNANTAILNSVQFTTASINLTNAVELNIVVKNTNGSEGIVASVNGGADQAVTFNAAGNGFIKVNVSLTKLTADNTVTLKTAAGETIATLVYSVQYAGADADQYNAAEFPKMAYNALMAFGASIEALAN